jgi:hypothetical protein
MKDVIVALFSAQNQEIALLKSQLRTKQQALDEALKSLEVKPKMKLMLDELRDDGWAVAAHNDYRLDGQSYTFWLFTRGNQCVRGEGLTDTAALIRVQNAIAELGTTLAGPPPRRKGGVERCLIERCLQDRLERKR